MTTTNDGAQVRRDALRSTHVMSAEDAIEWAGEIYEYVVMRRQASWRWSPVYGVGRFGVGRH